jgi:hypothetical protein
MMPLMTLAEWVREGLDPQYRVGGARELFIDIGPDGSNFPGEHLLVTPGSGGSLTTEDVFDTPAFEFLTVSEQNDYTGGEALAFAIDRRILGLISQSLGGIWVTSTQRFGGGPSVTEKDAADRWRFACTYVLEVESGLVPNG